MMQSFVLCSRLVSRAFVNGFLGLNVSTSQSQIFSSQNTLVNSSEIGAHSYLETTKKLRFVTAVSGFAKYQPLDVEKSRYGKFGDDAYFVSHHSSKGEVIGVADGVGGWRAWGIDPGEFSYCLMRACERLVRAGAFNSSDPAGIIGAAYKELLENKTQILGSSTACVIVLQGALGKIFSANIGDSGFLIVRDGNVVHRSQEQQHYFNTPFQLSLPPPGIQTQVLNDTPESASTYSFDIKVGDMLLLATDGIFDNMPDSMILDELCHLGGTSDSSMLQSAANAIAKQAQKMAFDEQYMSPFAVSARKNGINATGGKPDDITVILASVMA